MTQIILLLALPAFIRIGLNIANVIREKIALSRNTIVIANDHVEPAHLTRADIKHFILRGKQLLAGDTVTIRTTRHERLKGTVLGVDAKEEALLLANDSAVHTIQCRKIERVRLISRYGKFFT